MKSAFFTLALLLALLTIMSMSINAHALESVVLTDSTTEYKLGRHLEYFEDPGKMLGYDEVSSPAFESKWKRSDSDIPGFGFTNSAYWVRFRIDNKSSGKQFVLVLKCVRTGYIDFYMPDEKGQVVHKQSGVMLPFSQWEISDHVFAFRVPIQSDGTRVMYMRTLSNLGIEFPLVLYSDGRYLDYIKSDYIFRGFFFGIFFIMFLYNIILFFFSGERIFLYLSFFILFMGLYRLSVNNLLFEFTWPSMIYWNNISYQVFNYTSGIFFMLYSRKFLRIMDIAPKTNVIYNISIVFFSIGVIISFVNPAIPEMSLPVGLLFVFFPLITSFIYSIRGDINARLFLLSFSPGVIGLSIQLGILFLHIPLNITNFLDVTMTCVFFLMTITNSYSFNRSMRETQKSQEKIIDMQKEAADTLHRKVDERTRELAHALEEVETINERLSESNTILEGIGESLKRYLPAQLVSSIMKGEKSALRETERRKLTIFFSDICGFTETTDSMEAEELTALLNEYLEEMTAIANRWGGTVDKFVGDAIMVFFGAPESLGDREDALRCVRMAIAMQARMKELQEQWFRRGIEYPLSIRIGINTGMVAVGNFGAADRISYTAIGGQVNLASRIEGLCEPGGILISHPTWALVNDEIPCREKGRVTVKGIHREVLTYEVVL